MYIATVPNRNSPPAILLRSGYREKGKVKNRTLANLSNWPEQRVAMLRLLLRGESLAPLEKVVELAVAPRHGRLQQLLGAIKRSGVERMLASAPSRERALVIGMIAARILDPQRTLATARLSVNTTLADIFGVGGVEGAELDEALDWLARRRERIEKTLAARRSAEGLAAFLSLGSSRFDGRRVAYALLTDADGRPLRIRPVASAGDRTLRRLADEARKDYSLDTVILAGDHVRAATLARSRRGGKDEWFVVLETREVRTLIADRGLDPELVIDRGSLELAHPDFPGERLLAFRRPGPRKGIVVLRTNLPPDRLPVGEALRIDACLARTRKKFAAFTTPGRRRFKERVEPHFLLRLLTVRVEEEIRAAAAATPDAARRPT